MAFQKGQSGNPKGRPKDTQKLAVYIREQSLAGREIAEFLFRVFRGQDENLNFCLAEKKLAFRMDAAKELLNRGFGTAPQNIQINTVDDMLEPEPDELEFLMKLAEDKEAMKKYIELEEEIEKMKEKFK